MKNIPVSLKYIIEEFRKTLTDNYEQTEIMQFIYLLCEEWLGWNKAEVQLNKEKVMKGEEVNRFWDALEQLNANKPIQYIIGVTHFLDLKISVRKGVLIPRPETEELTAMILLDYQHRKYERFAVLDIGTGSGCIPLAVKKQMPGTDVTGLDISTVALEIASENAQLNSCDVRFIKADILDRNIWKDFPGYTIITSNPPYITDNERSIMHANVLEYEPYEALFVRNEDPLLFYKAIAEFAFIHLIRPGTLYLEINELYGKQIQELLISIGFERVDLLKDIHGKNRFIRAEAKTTMLDSSYWNVEH